MWCYCTASSHHSCNNKTGKIECRSDVKHCVIGKVGKRVTQSCWEWPSLIDSECPHTIGTCYLIGSHTKNPACCCKGNLCNVNTVNMIQNPLKNISTTTPFPMLYRKEVNISFFWIIICIFLFVSFLSLILAVFSKRFALWRKHYYKSKQKEIKEDDNIDSSNNDFVKIENDKDIFSIQNFNKGNLYKFCTKKRVIAKGRFGQVWCGYIDDIGQNGEKNVAIKTFSCNTEGKKSWENELMIYLMLRKKPHENILHFYGAEKVDQNSNLELWLVVEYHPLGSLWEYLKNNTVSWTTLLKICQDIAGGLRHLHCFSDHEDSPIAHRDIKSKNILLKSNLTACIADFGLAVCQRNYRSAFNNRVGTLYYMAPELLEGSINFNMNSFLRIDIFSMALVFWEVLSRCEFPGLTINDFHFPYQVLVGEKPTFEDLKYCVNNRILRPEFNPFWDKFPQVLTLWKTITECWDEDPEARINAECVLMRLNSLSNNYYES